MSNRAATDQTDASQSAVTSPQPRTRRPTIWLLLLAGLVLPISGLACWYLWPHAQHVGHGGEAFYHGLGQHDGPGFSGKNWYYARTDWGSAGMWEYSLDGWGWTPFRVSYPNGDLMGEGACWIGKDNGKPILGMDRFRNAKFYKPDGRLAAEITDGSGRFVLFYPNGTVSWELGVENERIHGRYVVRNENGTPSICGQCKEGDEVGTWYMFHPDGSVESIMDYSVDPPTTDRFQQGEKSLSEEELAELLSP